MFVLGSFRGVSVRKKTPCTSEKFPVVTWMQVSHIDPGVPIKLQLYAENAKGTSEPAVIDDALSSQHKHYVEGGDGDDDGGC